MSFGTSGLLYRSNKLMYDRGTETLWVQFEGKPAVGSLADSGLELEVLPVTLTTWGDWVALHPETTVLDINTGIYPARSYLPEDDPVSAYFEYRVGAEPIFPTHERSDLLPQKSSVLGLNINGRPKAYPLTLVKERKIVNDAAGGREVVVISTDGGHGARGYERGGLIFSDPQIMHRVLTVEDAQGRRWRVQEDALVLVDDPSRRLARLESRVSYWFGWFQFHPTTAVYE